MELLQPYENAKDAFVNKRMQMDSSLNFTYFSFVEQIEDAIRKLNMVEELTNAEIANNDDGHIECEVFSYNQMEEMSFNENLTLRNFKKEQLEMCNQADSEHFQFHDEFHLHSLHCIMSYDEFQSSTKELTFSQVKALRHVQALFSEKQLPFHIFITGGAGVGKTFMTRLLIAYIQLYQAKIFNSNPVIICAPTGTAANNIGGRTIHSVFKIPVGKYLHYSSLSPYALTILRKQFQDVHTVVIDEISMVSQELLMFISRRLSEIKNNDSVFGGCNIIVVGDFYQLKPVKGSFCFKNELLWHLFHPIFLTENVRQISDTSYSGLLNRIRIGHPTEKNISCLVSRLLYNEIDYNDYLHIFSTKENVEKYNTMQIEKLKHTTIIVRVNAQHSFSSDDSNTVGEVPDYMIPVNDVDAGGLKRHLLISEKARVMMTRNINAEQGLVNGAMGIVTEIIFQGGIPSVVFVKFDDPMVGKTRCNGQNTLHTSIPIRPVESECLYHGRRVIRTQFPLILAWACTVHKVQGISLDKAVIDLGSSIFEYGMAYVALSRIRTISGLFLIKFDPSKIKASDVVTKEYNRLGKKY